MKTKNLYTIPLDLNDIVREDTSSPLHLGKLEHAIDFLCEERTLVYAAAEGVVVKVVNDKKEGGPDFPLTDAGNEILIKHSNEEFSHYAHLKYHGVKVKVGDKVKTGCLLGNSGNTGFSYGPHLHFSVIKFIDPSRKDFESLEIQWL